MKKYIIGKYERKINMYGGIAVVIAALTPLPFSATSAVVGAIGYPINHISHNITNIFYFLSK